MNFGQSREIALFENRDADLCKNISFLEDSFFQKIRAFKYLFCQRRNLWKNRSLKNGNSVIKPPIPSFPKSDPLKMCVPVLSRICPFKVSSFKDLFLQRSVPSKSCVPLFHKCASRYLKERCSLVTGLY